MEPITGRQKRTRTSRNREGGGNSEDPEPS